MKIYSSPVAPSPRKVIIFIAEKGIENIQVKNLDLGKLEHKTSEYKKIAPNSRVPALELDSGEIILETTAICRYLECIYPEPNMFGSSPMEIAQIEMWYSRVSFELMMPLMHGFRHTHPHMSQLENQNNEFGIAQRELAIKSLRHYDEVIANKDYISCNKFTYADIQMVTSLQFLVRLNKIDISDYSNLDSYINNIAARPSFTA
ncbi:glutathione S-transferase family protein [Gammaproteobacteria bacterium]|nr:glutathione S-transferase family protein [Gammaproteobacteria bacterium]